MATSIWAASNGENPNTWSDEEATSRTVRFRVTGWKTFPAPPHKEYWQPHHRCAMCRKQGNSKAHDLRVTPVNTLCLTCWLAWPSCEICGVGARQPGYDDNPTYQGKHLCAECLVPEISEEYVRWQFICVAQMGSSFNFVVDGIPMLTTRVAGIKP